MLKIRNIILKSKIFIKIGNIILKLPKNQTAILKRAKI
jgi:hypothetical protein